MPKLQKSLFQKLRWYAFYPLRWVLARFNRWLLNKIWDLSHKETAHRGIRILVHDNAPKNAKTVIINALDLIAEVDPISFGKIARLLPGGLVASGSNRAWAWFNPQRKTCGFSVKLLASGDIGDVALCIVHEMCHARLNERGIGYGEAIRERVEKICIARELALAKKLENAGHKPYAKQTRHKLDTFCLIRYRYRDQDFLKRNRLEYLKSLRLIKDWPYWIRRVLVLRARKLIRRKRTRDATIVFKKLKLLRFGV